MTEARGQHRGAHVWRHSSRIAYGEAGQEPRAGFWQCSGALDEAPTHPGGDGEDPGCRSSHFSTGTEHDQGGALPGIRALALPRDTQDSTEVCAVDRVHSDAHRGADPLLLRRRPDLECLRVEPQPPVTPRGRRGGDLHQSLDHVPVLCGEELSCRLGCRDGGCQSRTAQQCEHDEAGTASPHSDQEHGTADSCADRGDGEIRQMDQQQSDAPQHHRQQGGAQVFHTRTFSRTPASSFSPIPGTASRSSTERNPPFSSRQSMIR